MAAAAVRPKRRRAGLPFILGGAALALLTFVAVLFYASSVGTGAGGNAPVVVAAHDLAIRVPIQAADLTIVQYNASDVPPGAFSKVAELSGVVAAINIAKGQPVTSNLVVNSTDAVVGPQSAYLPIPTGFVALTIPTGEQQGVGGYIQVGDYISMVAQVGGRTGRNVRTVYTNIHVIRIGPAAPASAAAQGSSNPPKAGGTSSTLTVIVTQCQAEFIGWFLANGSLSYTLESFHDYKPRDSAVDPGCPTVDTANGVSHADVVARWPTLFN